MLSFALSSSENQSAWSPTGSSSLKTGSAIDGVYSTDTNFGILAIGDSVSASCSAGLFIPWRVAAYSGTSETVPLKDVV